MDTLHAINSRVSVRKFKDLKVDTDAIGIILRAGMAAPSASDKRPWRFWVVENEDTIRSLASATPYATPALGAPLCIVVGNDPEVSTGMGIVDCSAAIQNMLLAIHNMGLGAVWIGCWPHDDRQASVRGILRIPDDIQIVSFIAVGYPAENTEPKNKWDPKKVVWM
jgi:nitroreductase